MYELFYKRCIAGSNKLIYHMLYFNVQIISLIKSRNLTFQTRKCVISLLFSKTSLQVNEFSNMSISLINEYTIEHFPVLVIKLTI